MYAVQSILHPTDFSERSADAFVHALRIAIAAKATLTIVHVASDPDQQEWASFPHVRETLANWGLMKASDSIEAIHAKTGVKVIKTAMGFAQMMSGGIAEAQLLHVGDTPPSVQLRGQTRPLPVAHRNGDVLDAVLDVANDWSADLIAMATAGHQGFMDALRGSTTEQLVRQAPCPVLAVPLPH